MLFPRTGENIMPQNLLALLAKVELSSGALTLLWAIVLSTITGIAVSAKYYFSTETKATVKDAVHSHEISTTAHISTQTALMRLEDEVQAQKKLVQVTQKYNEEAHVRQEKLLNRILEKVEAN
jgi:hypothetical protein